MKAAFFGKAHSIQNVYNEPRRRRLEELFPMYPHVVDLEDFEQHVDQLADLELIFSTWGMAKLQAEHIARLPKLRALFYAAGSVQGFAKPFLEAGVRVCSAWRANAVPVAEFAFAQVILANKGYFRTEPVCSAGGGWWDADRSGPGNFELNVSLLGAGAIGRLMIGWLKQLSLNVLVYDPFLPDEQAAELGVQKVSLEEAFARGNVVSNHLANKEEIRGLIKAEHFEAMPKNATFINTGRGAQIVEADMIAVLQKRADLIALLDVTHPEPPEPGSPMYTMPNIRLSSHIAGALGNEVRRLADWMIDDAVALTNGQAMSHEVTREMLETMA
jgi:phosphoglycerate dehydrogenase-like enzyme